MITPPFDEFDEIAAQIEADATCSCGCLPGVNYVVADGWRGWAVRCCVTHEIIDEFDIKGVQCV